MPQITRRDLLFSLAASTAMGAAQPPVYNASQDLLSYLDAAGRNHSVHSRKDWEKRREQILQGMQKVMGQLPPRIAPLRVEKLEEFEEDASIRQRIRYQSDPGDWVPAWLFVPKRFSGSIPAVVCLHQTTRIGKDEPAGLGGKENLHYAKELAARGYLTIAPDYPNFGEYTIDVYAKGYASATMKGIFNHMRAVDVIQDMNIVDGSRIGACGHSLGGHNALFLAVFDMRIRAAITSCGFTSFPKYFNGNLTGWSHKGYMPRIAELYGKSPARMPFDFPEVLAAIAPRGVFVNAPTHDSNFEVSGVEDCVRSASVVYRKIYNRPEALIAEYPEAQHDFPPQTREHAYAFLDRLLRR